ncbi:MAG TPA: acyl-ACP desaturase [Bacteroidota bacterium]|nr:acyl-ACP desaturase [Bacteroidota bacterium]
MHLTDESKRPQKFFSKLEVLTDLESLVKEFIEKHQAKRDLWFPSEFLPAGEHDLDENTVRELRTRARGIPDSAKVAITINIITEEGLPHFHRLIAENLGSTTFWSAWNKLWTAEEDRHGNILRDYIRDSRLLNFKILEELQFNYIRSGFAPDWRSDPYKVFIYTTCQEKATQISHQNTGRLAAAEEPLLNQITQKIAQDESKHYAFYMNVFKEILARDPNGALESASAIMPSIDMPGISISNFNEYADVIRRAGIYGPRDYKKIIEHLISAWNIDVMTYLNEMGRKAQEKIMSIPARLEKVAEYIETRSKAKSFRFDVVYGRVLDMA